MHIITHKEEDIVDICNVIHNGRYCVSQKASLCTEAGKVSVLVKSCHGLYNCNIIIAHIPVIYISSIFYGLLCQNFQTYSC